MLNGRSLDSVREAIRVGVDLLKWGEEMRLSLNLHHLFVVVIKDPHMVGVRDGRGWPVDHVAVQRGWAGGHDGCCHVYYLWGEKRGVNKAFSDKIVVDVHQGKI